jgi:CDP-glucose 4,6-dehydratase
MADLVTRAGRAGADPSIPPASRIIADFWHGRRVLVTGHTGFKGGWLSLWLQMMGSRIYGLSLGVPSQPSLYEVAHVADGMTDEINADVRNLTAVRDTVRRFAPEIVIHMAAQTLVRRSYADPHETFETNVMGVVNVLEAVRETSGVRVVVNVTSDKCYANRGSDWLYSEAEPMGGADPYSSSKGAAEIVTGAYRQSFFSTSETANVASARAGNVIGGGDWGKERLVPDIVSAAHAKRTLQIRNSEAVRPWQHVLNPLSGYLLLAQRLWTAPALATGWNFGPADDDAQPVRWLVEQLSDRWSGQPQWESDKGAHPPEAQYLKLDSSRARASLGWSPQVSLDAALDSIVAWYEAFTSGADMREVTTAQINQLARSDHPPAGTSAG